MIVKSYTITIITLLTVGLFSCNNTSIKNEASENSEAILTEGYKLLNTHCLVCHTPPENQDSRVAPPLLAIKEHYALEGVTREQFIKEVSEYAQNPSEEKSRLTHAVEQFGLMPQMNFDKGIIEKIAGYMYDTDVENSKWLELQTKGTQTKHSGLKDVEIYPETK